MNNTVKNQKQILNKLNIIELNEMQKKAISIIPKSTNTIILSPTGTGKTLAFLLPILANINSTCNEVQVLIIVPSRELAIQIEQVLREMGTGLKVNAVYGGRAMSKDKIELKHTPSILIGTPGRLSDHFSNNRFSKSFIKTLILDEFDKSLEVGFEYDIKGIIKQLPKLNKRILTSATQETQIPNFLKLNNPNILNFLTKKKSKKLKLKAVSSPSKNKNHTLIELLRFIGNKSGIIFCNLKNSIKYISDFMEKNNIKYVCFYGGMEQRDRERSLIKFRNGSTRILIATDLAARGIDIPEIHYIIHYELPPRVEEFTHRNGRTARMHSNGIAYILKHQKETLPEFMGNIPNLKLNKQEILIPTNWDTLFISGGRKDKISKGDIAGLFFKKGGLAKEQLGIIELKQDCAFVAVASSEINRLVKELNNYRLKNKKVRVMMA